MKSQKKLQTRVSGISEIRIKRKVYDNRESESAGRRNRVINKQTKIDAT